MLVSCAKCKSPVFVSSAVVAMGEAEVGCSSCGTRLKVSSSGHSTVVGVPAPVLDLSALPSYEGGAAPAVQPATEGATPVDPAPATVETPSPALESAAPTAPPLAGPPARPPDAPPSRRGPRGSAGQLPSFLSAVPLSAVLSEGLSGMPASSGAASQLARASDAAGGFGSAAPSALPWGSTAATPWPPAASAPAAGADGGATAATPSPEPVPDAGAAPTAPGESATGRRAGAAQIVLAAPRAEARADTRTGAATVAEPSRPATEPPPAAVELPRPEASRGAAAPAPRAAEAARPVAAPAQPRAVSAAVAGPARGPLASLGEPSTLFPPARAGAQRIPVSRRPLTTATSAPAWRPLAFAALGVVGALALVAVLWAASSGGDRAGSKTSPAALTSASPTSALGHYRQANALIAEHKPAEAVDELRKGLEVDPAFGLAYRSLGVAYMMLGRERSAVEAYDHFAALEPAHSDADQARRIVEAYRRRPAPTP